MTAVYVCATNGDCYQWYLLSKIAYMGIGRFRGLYSVPKDEQRAIHAIIARLGRELAAKRKERGLTQEQVAEKLDLSVNMVRAVETSSRVPGLPTLIRMARLLRIDSIDFKLKE